MIDTLYESAEKQHDREITEAIIESGLARMIFWRVVPKKVHRISDWVIEIDKSLRPRSPDEIVELVEQVLSGKAPARTMRSFDSVISDITHDQGRLEETGTTAQRPVQKFKPPKPVAEYDPEQLEKEREKSRNFTRTPKADPPLKIQPTMKTTPKPTNHLALAAPIIANFHSSLADMMREYQECEARMASLRPQLVMALGGTMPMIELPTVEQEEEEAVETKSKKEYIYCKTCKGRKTHRTAPCPNCGKPKEKKSRAGRTYKCSKCGNPKAGASSKCNICERDRNGESERAASTSVEVTRTIEDEPELVEEFEESN